MGRADMDCGLWKYDLSRRHGSRRGVFALALPGLLTVGLSARLAAQPSVCWTGGAEGSFLDPSRWEGGAVPGADDTACFGSAAQPLPEGGATVHLDAFGGFGAGDAECWMLELEEGTLRLELGDRELVTRRDDGGRGLAVGTVDLEGDESRAAELTIQGGSADLVFIGAGSESGSIGRLVISGTDVEADINSGDLGDGEVVLRDGATLHSGIEWMAFIGTYESASGRIEVLGPGTSWTHDDHQLWVGYRGPGTLRVADGGQLVTTTSWIILGVKPSGDGTFVIEGEGSRHEVTSWLSVGHAGTGRLEVSSGGELLLQQFVLFVGGEIGSRGSVAVSRDGSVSGAGGSHVLVGNEGKGQLSITDGGEVTCSQIFLGSESGSSGDAWVAGPGSRLQASEEFSVLSVGRRGRGTLEVREGGEVAADRVRIGEFASAPSGRITVVGPEATLSFTSQLVVGLASAGTLQLASGGRVLTDSGTVTVNPRGTLVGAGTVEAFPLTNRGLVSPGDLVGRLEVDGDFTQADGTLEIDVAGTEPETEHDVLAVGGAAALGGTLLVRAAPGFLAAEGDVYELLTATSVVGEFDEVRVLGFPADVRVDVRYLAGAVAAVVVPAEPEPLELGVEVPLTLSELFPERLLALTVPAGVVPAALVVSVEDAEPLDANRLWARWDGAPSPLLFDHAAAERHRPSQRLVVPRSRVGELWLLVRGDSFEGGESEVTLRVDAYELELESTSLRYLGEGKRQIHAAVRGGGFDAATRFSLEREGGGETREASATTLLSVARADARFDLGAAPAGTYDLVARGHGEEARLEGALEILAAEELEGRRGPLLAVEVISADRFRRGRIGRLLVRYRNVGDEEMAAPLLRVRAPEGAELRLTGAEAFEGSELLALGTQGDAVAGRLVPGGEGELSVSFRSESCLHCELELTVEVLREDARAFVGWEALPAPEGMSGAEWDEARTPLSGLLGATWREYAEGLARQATRLGRRGRAGWLGRDLFRFAVREASPSRGNGAIVGTLRDADSGAALGGVEVAAMAGGEPWAVGETSASGRFRLEGLAGGATYRLELPGGELVGCEGCAGGLDVRLPESGDVLALELAGRGGSVGLLECARCEESGLPEEAPVPPDDLFRLAAAREVTLVSAIDPNEKDGPKDAERPRPVRDWFQYTVHFENDAKAPVPADEVVITDELDAGFDASTVQLLGGQIGGRYEFDFEGLEVGRYEGEARASRRESYEGQVVRRIEHPLGGEDLLLVVNARIDTRDRQVEWRFRTLDLDGNPPADIDAGFLPPNRAEWCGVEPPAQGEEAPAVHCGEGSVSFLVRPRADISSEREVRNRARIRFVGAPVVDTNELVHLVAPEVAPGAARYGFPRTYGEYPYPVDVGFTWSGDAGAEVHDLYLWREGEGRPSEPTASGLTEPAYRPSEPLEADTAYRWQVVSRSAVGETESEEWEFRTSPERSGCPEAAWGPEPADGSVEVEADAVLGWAEATGAERYAVYLWRSGTDRPERPVADGLLASALGVEGLDGGREYLWQVVSRGEECDREGAVWSFTTTGLRFVRGDVDGSGHLTITDPVRVLGYLFLGEEAPGCERSADSDRSGGLDLSDAVYVLNFLFLGGPAPPAPYPECGEDPEPSALGCLVPPECP